MVVVFILIHLYAVFFVCLFLLLLCLLVALFLTHCVKCDLFPCFGV